MVKENCILVRTAGRQLDQMRAEASRIAKARKIDWWTDPAEIGTRFCFEDKTAKETFAAACVHLGVACQDG